MHRLSKAVKHVVGDVDDVVDRAQAYGLQPQDPPIGRGADFQTGDHRARVSVTTIRVFQLDRYVTGLTGSRLDRMGTNNKGFVCGNSRTVDGAGRCCRYLAGKTLVRQKVWPIWKDIDHKSRVADRHGVEKPGPGLGGNSQRHDAFVILTESQLFRRAEHALGSLAANFSLLYFDAPRQSGAHRCEWVESVGRDVGGATDDVENRSATGVDLRQPESIGVRMLLDLDHPADDDVAQIFPECNQIIHCCTA